MTINLDKEPIQNLKKLIRDLFQFDFTELDFGIYRIMNYKKGVIKDFIDNDLIIAAREGFEKYKTENKKDLLEKIDEKRKEIKKLEEGLGEKILKNNEIEEKFKDKPLAKEYIELNKQIEDIDITENIQTRVFNDLYNFFSGYYEDGDFIAKRRYSSKKHRYAIPYSGEEVKLYWANFDQYYIKTGEIFKDYEFNLKDWTFIFRTVIAEVEIGNIIGKRRYFLLSSDDPIEINNRICLINFEYRPLTDEDSEQYPVKTKEGKPKSRGIKQNEINSILKDRIFKVIPIEPKNILKETRNGKTILEKHLYKYTKKITSDFFIHKNLKHFLETELDYFIKTKVLDIKSLDTNEERNFIKHITRAKVVKNIAKRIIEFLSGIEEFQKLLWEKKKFILKTDYVITIDRIPEEFYKEILTNEKQLKEWEDLGFGKYNKIDDFIDNKNLINTEYKKLPIDTKYFNANFKERLLEKLSEDEHLEDLIDGVLIKSENWQALNLIVGKYKEKIQCIYIDPPFNTGKDFLYKDNYQDSSWITLMENRLNIAKKLLTDTGNLYLHLDENAHYYGRLILNYIFGNENFQREILWNTGENISGFKSIAPNWIRQHDVILNYSKSKRRLFRKLWEPINDSLNIGWLDIIGSKKDRNLFIEKWRNDEFFNENLDIKKVKPLGSIWNDIYSFQYSEPRITESFGFETQKPENLIRRFIQSSTEYKEPKNIIMDFFVGSGTTLAVAHKLNRKWLGVEMEKYFNEFYISAQEVKKQHIDMYNIVNIIKENKNSVTANVKKIGILGRLKIVLNGDKNFKIFKLNRGTHLSKDINWQGGGFFKYHCLEQYEDTLYNIEFPKEEKGQKMLELLPEEEKIEYLMKYMLKFETEGSPSLLNPEQFENPFEYKLKIISSGKGEEIVNIDLVETFNYLIGLNINKYRFLNENGRKYVFVFGERNNRNTAIIWRSTKDIELEKDKEIVDKILNDFNPDEIFINGDSFVKDFRPIEIEFKNLMGI